MKFDHSASEKQARKEHSPSSQPVMQEEKQAEAPKDKKQVEQEHQAALAVEIARINKKYEWTDSSDKTAAVRVVRREKKDAFRDAHQGVDHHGVKKQEIMLVSAMNRASSDMEKELLKEHASKGKDKLAIDSWKDKELVARARSDGQKKEHDDKEHYTELGKISRFKHHELLPDDAAHARKIVSEFYKQRDEQRHGVTENLVNALRTGRITALDKAYSDRAEHISADHDRKIEIMRKKYPQGAAEWDRDQAAQSFKREERRPRAFSFDHARQEQASPAVERSIIPSASSVVWSANEADFVVAAPPGNRVPRQLEIVIPVDGAAIHERMSTPLPRRGAAVTPSSQREEAAGEAVTPSQQGHAAGGDGDAASRIVSRSFSERISPSKSGSAVDSVVARRASKSLSSQAL